MNLSDGLDFHNILYATLYVKTGTVFDLQCILMFDCLLQSKQYIQLYTASQYLCTFE